MELEQARKRAEELRVIIEKNNRLYYDQDAPELEDFEYDAMTRELKAIEKEYPELVTANSPTQHVGGTASSKFSYGAGYGTENDNWYKATSELEPEAMVAELRAQGMAGIYLDLDGYTEEEQQPTLQALINAAGCDESDVIISEGGTLCYIPLGKG